MISNGHSHEGSKRQNLIYIPSPRCTTCGHRLPFAPGMRPIESRRLPWWTWPAELIMRWTVKRLGRPGTPDWVWMGEERAPLGSPPSVRR